MFAKGAGPCALEEAQRRVNDPDHPWIGRWLRRAKTHTAMNALIQGSAARHTKLWMRACWREGIVPLLQMHDALDCSVTSPEQAELVARLGCDAVKLAVPMRVDLKFGRPGATPSIVGRSSRGGTAGARPSAADADPDQRRGLHTNRRRDACNRVPIAAAPPDANEASPNSRSPT